MSDPFQRPWSGRFSFKDVDMTVVLTMAGMVAAVVFFWYVLALILVALGCPLTLLLLAGLGGAVWYKSREARIRAERAMAGYCVKCGYDLRASPGRCPECGEVAVDEVARRRQIFDEIRKAKAGMSTNAPVRTKKPPPDLPPLPLEP